MIKTRSGWTVRLPIRNTITLRTSSVQSVLRGGYEDTLRYQRRKVTLGSDNYLSFGTWNSSLSYNKTENKGRLITNASVPAATGLAGTKRDLEKPILFLIPNW